MNDIPVWDTSSLYQGFDDPRYLDDQATVTKSATKILKLLKNFPEGKKERHGALAGMV